MLKRKPSPPGLHPIALKSTVSLLKWLTNLGLTSGHCGCWAVQSQCRASWFRPEHHLLAQMPVGEAAGYQGEEKTGWDRGCKYISVLNPFLADLVSAKMYIIAGSVLIGNHNVILNEALSLLS